MLRITPRSLTALALAAMSAVAFGGAPVTAAAPHTFMVDADGYGANGNCDASAAAHTTIQSAIAAARPGDTVKVCPGDYTEHLVVRAAKHDISIVSTQPWGARIWRATSLPGATPLVEIRSGANGVSFKHFTLLFPTTSTACDAPTEAAIVVEATGAQIRANRIRADSTDPGFSTCGYSAGVVVAPTGAVTTSATRLARVASVVPASAPPASAMVGWNTIRDFQFFGVILVGPHTRGTTQSNSIHFGHQGATACTAPASTSALPAGHVSVASPVLACLSFGIIYADRASGLVRSNVVVSDFHVAGPASVGAPLLYAGIVAGLDGPGGNVTIANNTVAFTGFGIAAETEGSDLIENNSVSFNLVYGIGIEGGSGVVVKNNTVAESAGLFANTSSSGNIFRNNTVSGGGCEDDSSGADTAGTANHWVGDIADSSSPAGLCEPPVNQASLASRRHEPQTTQAAGSGAISRSS